MTLPREGRPWTADEDAIILAHRYREPWEVASRQLVGRSPLSCASRFDRLRLGKSAASVPRGSIDANASIRESTRLLGEAIERYLAKRRAA